MPDHQDIYAKHGDRYQQLVRCEDYSENLRSALTLLIPSDKPDIIELGAGTGRLTRILAPLAGRIFATDLYCHMLKVLKTSQHGKGNLSAELAGADYRRLPFKNNSTDFIVAGWSIGYLAAWHAGALKQELESTFDEIRRVLRPGGSIVIIETLGTGCARPRPFEIHAEYLDYLKRVGFRSDWIRTDYRFDSLEEAVSLSRFFFGEEMATQVRKKRQRILPECTGIWSLTT